MSYHQDEQGYFAYAKAYWSGISDSCPGAITPGHQWEQSEEHAEKLVGHLDRSVTVGQDVLEYGCGEGRIAIAMAHRFNRYTGVDISRTCLRRAMDLQIRNAMFIDAEDFNPIPYSFDVIVSWTVFMHMPHWMFAKTIARLVELLKPGGWLCFQLSMACRPGEQRYDLVPDENLWTPRWYPDAYIIGLLEQFGLTIAQKQTDWDTAWRAKK